MSEDNECSVFISPEQKRALIMSIFSAYYHPQAEKEVIFDTNRLWCSKLHLIKELFPEAKVICCVRNIAWIMDSIEILIRRNAFDVSRLFNNPAERATVYSRTEALSQGSRLVGYAYNALKEAFYSEQSASILLVDYELLTINPAKTILPPDLFERFDSLSFGQMLQIAAPVLLSRSHSPARVKTLASKRKSS